MPVDPFAAAVELVRLLRAGDVSSRDLVELHLERIERLNGPLNAVVTVDEAGARRRADDLDCRRARGGPVGLLHGLPLTVKDCWATQGMRTTAGSPDKAELVPEADAEVVARLRAAAVAAGLSPLEVGSDSGGSIREPAHCCGVYGHFPTSGLVPLAGHLPSVPVEDTGADVDLMAAGPLARSADDLALAMRVLAGLVPPDELPAPESLRVAVWLGPSDMPPSQDVASLIRAAGDALASVGASVREAAPAFDVAEARDVAFQLWVAASASSASDDDHARAVEKAAGTSPEDRSLSALRDRAQALSHRDWLRLDARRRSFARSWAALFEEVDVVVCPVSPVPAVRHDPVPEEVHSVDRRLARTIHADGRDRPYLDQIMWNIVVGMAGLPSTVAPVGRTAGGLPVGAQVVGRRGADALTIAVAGLLGDLTGGYALPPGFG